jgi:hypothetical protein
MSQNWNSSLADEQRKINEIERWDQAVFRPHRMPTPSYIDHESLDGLTKRLINKSRHLVSEDLQKVKTNDVFGSALDHFAKQFFDSAAQEAVRPSKVPDGSLKEITKYDQSGRPFYEYYGSPKSWLADFSHPRKKLLGIINPDADKFKKM